MPHPRIEDDGHTVTLDLHGATVDDAVRLASRAVVEAQRRGRTTVKLIHGSSTSGRPGKRTIKSALRDAIDDGHLGITPANVWRSDDFMVLSLEHASRRDPKTISLLDIQR